MSKKQLNMIQGGGVFPTKRTEYLGTVTMPGGETAKYYADWKTGWFSKEEECGPAYEVPD